MPVRRLKDYDPDQLETLKIKLLRLGMPERPFDNFDEYGLRWPTEWLNEVGLTVVLFPLEWQVQYVDRICDQALKDADNDLINESLSATEAERVDSDLWNATAIGNLAAFATRAQWPDQRNKALALLDKMEDFWRKKLITMLGN
jgi:hypothetical protein